MSSAVPNSPKAKALGGGNPEAISAHSEEEDASEDEDEVIETALNGRWQKLNVKVGSSYLVTKLFTNYIKRRYTMTFYFFEDLQSILPIKKKKNLGISNFLYSLSINRYMYYHPYSQP